MSSIYEHELPSELTVALIEGCIAGRAECLEAWNSLKNRTPQLHARLSLDVWGDLELQFEAVQNRGELIVDLRKVL